MHLLTSKRLALLATHTVAACLFWLTSGFEPAHANEKYDWLVKSITLNYQVDPAFNQPIETQITFANGHVAKTRILNFRLVDYLVSSEGVTFIIFSGRDCTECDAENSLYIDAIKKNTYDVSGYTFPGRYYLQDSQQLLGETRVFYGQCLTPHTEVNVAFISRHFGMQQQLKVLYLNEDKVSHSNQNATKEIIDGIEVNLSNGRCFEIYGNDVYSE